MRIIAVVLDHQVIHAILKHLRKSRRIPEPCQSTTISTSGVRRLETMTLPRHDRAILPHPRRLAKLCSDRARSRLLPAAEPRLTADTVSKPAAEPGSTAAGARPARPNPPAGPRHRPLTRRPAKQSPTLLAFVLDHQVVCAILKHLRKSRPDPRALPEHDEQHLARPP